MTDQPLQPFSWPKNLPTHLPPGISAGSITLWILYVIFAFWALYTLVATYHWLKYSNTSWIAFPAIAFHILISLALISYILSGNALYLSPYLP